MKKLLLLAFIFLAGNVFGQKRANIWQLGTAPQSYAINFNPGFADTFRLIRKLNFFGTNASICDTDGNLLFYTNGVWIANRNHNSLLNTKNFNPGWATSFYGDVGLGFTQAAIVIPKPGDASKYLLFSSSADTVRAYGIFRYEPLSLNLSVIDMKLDSGLGGIPPGNKDIHVVKDTLIEGRITACKHANGRDWWVVVHKFHSDCYYKLLIEPDKILGPFEQCIGNNFLWDAAYGMAVFSPDGSKYAQINENDTIDLLDFDRCSGEFSNPRTLIVPDSGALSGTLGCSFSPNSRFLYANSYLELWQFDTEVQNPNQSRILIDTVCIDSIFQWLFTNQLAPDHKIYISTFNGTYKLSVINSPDSLGKSCGFALTGFNLPPLYDNLALPNLPNYDLGPLLGSSCDTVITILSPISQPKFTHNIYPNPCTGKFQLSITGVSSKIETVIYNEMGEVIEQTTLQPVNGFIHGFFNLQNEPSGVYFLKAETDRGEVAEKILKE